MENSSRSPWAPTEQPQRLVSLDVFRGLTIAGMIVVNSPGLNTSFSWVAHSPWNGWTLADLVFPSFLVIMGLSLTLSLSRRKKRGDPPGALLRQIIKRTLVIYGFGLLSAFLMYRFNGAQEFRFTGVLQRISFCYAACSLLYLFAETKTLAWTTAGLLLGYWALMTLVPVPGHGRGDFTPAGNLASYLDRMLLHGHMMDPVEDPEGLLATLPAIANSLMGVLAGVWLASPRGKREKAKGLLAAGIACAALGELWGRWFPINKHIWTSSFVLLTGGLALIGLTLCYAWLDEPSGWRRLAGKPFEIFGRNPLIAYFASGLFFGVLEFISVPSAGPGGDARLWFVGHFLSPWLAPKEASLAFALLYTAACLGFMDVLHRRRIYVKI